MKMTAQMRPHVSSFTVKIHAGEMGNVKKEICSIQVDPFAKLDHYVLCLRLQIKRNWCMEWSENTLIQIRSHTDSARKCVCAWVRFKTGKPNNMLYGSEGFDYVLVFTTRTGMRYIYYSHKMFGNYFNLHGSFSDDLRTPFSRSPCTVFQIAHPLRWGAGWSKQMWKMVLWDIKYLHISSLVYFIARLKQIWKVLIWLCANFCQTASFFSDTTPSLSQYLSLCVCVSVSSICQ